MILGGYPYQNELITDTEKYRRVHIFDGSANSFTDGPFMLFDRSYAACTLFYSQKHGNRPVILAAGGAGDSIIGDSKTAEVFDYTVSNSWEESKHRFYL